MHQSRRSSNEVLESRIDWLTATVGPGYKQAILATRAAEWQARRIAEGYPLKQFRWSGYLGEATDGITWGTREDGSILRLSGEMAHKHALTALTFAANVSRIDIQVTIQDKKANIDYARVAIALASRDARVRSGMTRTSIIRSTPSGTTAYIGSRSSDRYFRVYDKTAESQGVFPNQSWRYEIEYKKYRAWRVAQQILNQHGSPEAIRQIVEAAFLDYGVVLPCLALPPGWRDKGIRLETNDERRLAWLTKSIAPLIEKLLESTSIDVLCTALGLDGLLKEAGPIFTDEEVIDGFPRHEPDSGSWEPAQGFGSGSGT